MLTQIRHATVEAVKKKMRSQINLLNFRLERRYMVEGAISLDHFNVWKSVLSTYHGKRLLRRRSKAMTNGAWS